MKTAKKNIKKDIPQRYLIDLQSQCWSFILTYLTEEIITVCKWVGGSFLTGHIQQSLIIIYLFYISGINSPHYSRLMTLVWLCCRPCYRPVSTLMLIILTVHIWLHPISDFIPEIQLLHENIAICWRQLIQIHNRESGVVWREVSGV